MTEKGGGCRRSARDVLGMKGRRRPLVKRPAPPAWTFRHFLELLAILSVVAALDLASGPEQPFSLVYLFPAAIASWRGGSRLGLMAALLTTAVWTVVETTWASDMSSSNDLANLFRRGTVLAVTAVLVSRLKVRLETEARNARTDPLTGLANRLTFEEALSVEIARVERSGRPFSLVLLDIDDFKEVNDRLGHPAGDGILQEVARVLEACTRRSDVVSRLGGDEFALLLCESGADDARAAAERVFRDLGRIEVFPGRGVSVSAGVAVFPGAPASPAEAYAAADSLLLRAKEAGKARLIVDQLPRGTDEDRRSRSIGLENPAGPCGENPNKMI